MSVTHKKDANRVAELETEIVRLKDEISKRDEVIEKQLTDAQIALCEIFESMVNDLG